MEGGIHVRVRGALVCAYLCVCVEREGEEKEEVKKRVWEWALDGVRKKKGDKRE
jgi:hypothetical protein